ncbi:hypothetical protein QR685DRAFT_447282, partial [Neurospora intermedia]
IGTQAIVPLRTERYLTIKLNGKPLLADKERHSAADIIDTINKKYPKTEDKAVIKI